jgi:hypothetical protein
VGSERSRKGHLSIFDRPYAETDTPPPGFEHLVAQGVDVSSVRLALVARGRWAYVAFGTNDTVYLLTVEPGRGSGASGGPRSNLEEHGVACFGATTHEGGTYVKGIVGDRRATLGYNVFIADVESVDASVTIVSDEGEREVSLRPPTRRHQNLPPAELPRYVGTIEYAGGATCTVEIDDVDSAEWRGTPRTILVNGNAPDSWFVGVRLLDGPRAGELAFADLVVTRHPERSAAFVGKTRFTPTNSIG